MHNNIALIVAAGKGARFASEQPKQYNKLHGTAILRHTLLAFLRLAEISHIQVVIHPDDLALYTEATSGLTLLPPVFGGDTRQDSVRMGLEALEALSPQKVLIHDAARPFLSKNLILSILHALEEVRAVIPLLPIYDTIKQREEDNIVAATLDRETLGIAQTPQGFYYRDILSLHQRFKHCAFTDDAALYEHAGSPVHSVEGEVQNKKITTKEDVMTQYETRIGSGFDAHRFKEASSENPHIMLCGVAVPHLASLEAHSDGDVALHALVDALLGTIAGGDIGLHFPPSDPKWKNANSKQFVEHACQMVKQLGGRIVNADITLIGEAPRIGPYRALMAESVAHILGVEISRVNIKATTTEKMGFTGRKEGLAAQAVVSVEITRG